MNLEFPLVKLKTFHSECCYRSSSVLKIINRNLILKPAPHIRNYRTGSYIAKKEACLLSCHQKRFSDDPSNYWHRPMPMAALSKAWAWDNSLVGIAGLNFAAAWVFFCCECCV